MSREEKILIASRDLLFTPLKILFNNPSDDSHCNIAFFINMCYNKGYFIFLTNGAAVVATVSNGVDAQF